jgi:hypothetical protein
VRWGASRCARLGCGGSRSRSLTGWRVGQSMAEPMLFEPDPVPEAPLRYLAESAMVRMLEERHTRVSMGAHRWAFADHVPNQPWGAVRICDFLAVDCYGTYGAEQNPAHGFEIKASRADWLTELRSPDKAEAFKRYCNRWWLVVSDRRIVRDGELPEGWGLLAVAGSTLRAVKPAPRLSAEAWPRPLVASFARAVAKSARRSA